MSGSSTAVQSKCIFSWGYINAFLFVSDACCNTHLLYLLLLTLYISRGFSPICTTYISIENFDLLEYIYIFLVLFVPVL